MKKEPELGSNIWFLAPFLVFQAGSSILADSLGLSFCLLGFRVFRPLFLVPDPIIFSSRTKRYFGKIGHFILLP
jgi:hypothetical protein